MPQIPRTPTPFESAPEYAGNISDVFQMMGKLLFGGGPERALDLIGGPMMTHGQLADTAKKIGNLPGVSDEVIDSLMLLRDHLDAGSFDPVALEQLESFFAFPKGAYGPNTVGITGVNKSQLPPKDVVRTMMFDEMYAQKKLVPPGSYEGMPHLVGIDPTVKSRVVLPHEIEHLFNRTSKTPTEAYRYVESMYPQAKAGEAGLEGAEDLIRVLQRSEVDPGDLYNTFINKVYYSNPNELVAEMGGYKAAYPGLQPQIESPLALWLRQGGFPVKQRSVNPGTTPPPRVVKAWEAEAARRAAQEKLP